MKNISNSSWKKLDKFQLAVRKIDNLYTKGIADALGSILTFESVNGVITNIKCDICLHGLSVEEDK